MISFSGSHCWKRAAAILVRNNNISGAARSHSNSAVKRASSKEPAGLPASPAVQLTPGNIKLLIKQIQKERRAPQLPITARFASLKSFRK